MNKILIRKFVSILVWVFAFCVVQQATCEEYNGNKKSVISSRYISVSEYLRLHPEERSVSVKFSKIVSGPGKPITSGQQQKKVKNCNCLSWRTGIGLLAKEPSVL